MIVSPGPPDYPGKAAGWVIIAIVIAVFAYTACWLCGYDPLPAHHVQIRTQTK